MTERVTAFAPATVSNVACGFDVFGFAIEGLGDEVEAERQDEPGVAIDQILHDHGRLPRDPEKNTASVAARAVLARCGARGGVRLTVKKGIPLASGLGGSAASAVAAAVATNHLLGARLSSDELLACALAGERIASRSTHADNVAPSLLGGFVLVRQPLPPDVVTLPVPDGLTCALLHPWIEIETHAARACLGDSVPLASAVRQWANTAALVAALFRGDLELLRRSLEDHVAEPARRLLVPGFDAVRRAALEAGALGCSLSGSGPTLFALTASPQTGEAVSLAMAEAYRELGEGPADRWVSPISSLGAQLRETPVCA